MEWTHLDVEIMQRMITKTSKQEIKLVNCFITCEEEARDASKSK